MHFLVQHELPATRTALTSRFGKAALETALRRGQVERVLSEFYAATPIARTTRVRAAATSRWLGDRGVVGGTTAAFLMGLLASDPRVVHVVGRPRMHVRGPAWMRIRHRAPEPRTVVTNGVLVAQPADVAIQAWEQLPSPASTNVVIEAVRCELTSAAIIAARARDYPTLRRRRELVALLDDLAGGIDSFLELHAAREVFVGPGFPTLERHVKVRTTTRVYEADFYHREARVDIETDGRRFHSRDDARRRDIERDVSLAATGTLTLRFTFEDIMGRPQWCRRQTMAAIDARLAPPPPTYG